jgi:hypothetical protein
MNRTIFQICVAHWPYLLKCMKLLQFKWFQPSSFLTTLCKCGDRVRAKIASCAPKSKTLWWSPRPDPFVERPPVRCQTQPTRCIGIIPLVYHIGFLCTMSLYGPVPLSPLLRCCHNPSTGRTSAPVVALSICQTTCHCKPLP